MIGVTFMIIDAHTHTGSFIGFEMPEENLLTAMQRYGIDIAICSNCESAEFDCDHNPVSKELSKTQEEVFRANIAFARRNADKIRIMPWVKPHTQGVTAELEQLIKDNLDITVGIKVHPYHSFIAFDSPAVEEYIKLAEKYNLPILTHTGNSDEDCCMRVYKMAKKYPNVNFIMGHMGLGTDNSEAIELISKQPNLYGDTAWVPIESVIKLIGQCSSEKVLFGTDATIDGTDTYRCNKAGEPSIYLKYFNELKQLLPKSDYDNLMYKNAARLFGIEDMVKNKG